MSHDIVNELITIMGHSVLRKVLSQIKCQNPGWFSLIADEATDVNNREQLNLSIRYVDDDYVVHEDPIAKHICRNSLFGAERSTLALRFIIEVM